MDAIGKLREEIAGYDFLSREYRDRLLTLIEAVEYQLYDDLVSVGTAAKMLDVSERQVHNIACDPSVDFWKYNTDGRRKTDNRRTKTCYRVSEILKYREENK